MISTQVRLLVLVFATGVVLVGTAPAQEEQSSDERAISALMDKINLAMTAETPQKGVEIMKAVISDKGYTIVQANPGDSTEALVADKKMFLEFLSDSLQNGPRWGVHEVQQIAIVGPIAYTVGESKAPDQADARSDKWLNIFAKEDVGWKLVYSTRADGIQKAMRQLNSGVRQPDARRPSETSARPENDKASN